MLAGGDIPDLVECVDANSIRVYALSPVLFVCGGRTSVKEASPISLRDAFMRIAFKKPFDRYEVLLAEGQEAFFPRGNYKDILSLESDMAQISDLIILFSESFGSAAELGAFAVMESIAPKLMVVMDDEHYLHDSFIRLGPVRSIENAFGEQTVCVLNRADISIKSILDVSNIDINSFQERIISAFLERIKINTEHTRFNSGRVGHVIKFIVGLVQHYGALTYEEIDIYLYYMKIEKAIRNRLPDLLLCAEFSRWIVSQKRGVNTYFVAMKGREAMQYDFIAGERKYDKLRWRSDIIEYWKINDKDRFSCIKQIRGAS